MKADLSIRNARVVDHTGEFYGGIAVKDGKILVTGTDAALPEAKRIIDAEGRCLMPGVIDTHCHLGIAYPFDEDMHGNRPGRPRRHNNYFLVHSQ